MLCIISIPLGFGEDFFLCSINTFSALHLRAKYANWLNMVWSLGATAGPYIMSLCLAGAPRGTRATLSWGPHPDRRPPAVFVLPRQVEGDPFR